MIENFPKSNAMLIIYKNEDGLDRLTDVVSGFANLNIRSPDLLPDIIESGSVGPMVECVQGTLLRPVELIQGEGGDIVEDFLQKLPDFFLKEMKENYAGPLVDDALEDARSHIVTKAIVNNLERFEGVTGNLRSLLQNNFLNDYLKIFYPTNGRNPYQPDRANQFHAFDSLQPGNVRIDDFALTTNSEGHGVKVINPSFIGDPDSLTVVYRNLSKKIEELRLAEKAPEPSMR